MQKKVFKSGLQPKDFEILSIIAVSKHFIKICGGEQRRARDLFLLDRQGLDSV